MDNNLLKWLVVFMAVTTLLSSLMYYYSPSYDLHIKGDDSMYLIDNITGDVSKCLEEANTVKCR